MYQHNTERGRLRAELTELIKRARYSEEARRRLIEKARSIGVELRISAESGTIQICEPSGLRLLALFFAA